jgi:lipoprotein-releasing system permease protein
MRFELHVALRYLLARRKQAFISVISLISTMGVAVGVMALVIALALTTGLQGEMRDRLLGSTGHAYVWKTGGGSIEDYHAEVSRLRGVEGVVGVGPAILGKALVTSATEQMFINIKGIDPQLEPSVTDIKTTLRKGSIDGLTAADSEELPGILLGDKLASQLSVDVGDSVSLLTPQSGSLTPMGLFPRSRSARVVGIFSLGMLEFDTEWGFVSLEFAERLVGAKGAQLLQIRVEDAEAAPAVVQRITTQLGDSYFAEDWQDLNQSLFAALWMEKVVISITISLIVIVAALQIVASLVLMVMEKSRDIGILKTMGTSPRRISQIFMLQGLIIGIIGTTIGAVCALALCWVLDHYRLIRIPMDVYQVTYVPFVVEPRDFLIVIGSAVVICFLATIYPSRQAAKLDPVQALRFE